MDVGCLLDRVRVLLRAPASCGVPSVDRVVAGALVPGKLLRPDLVVRSAAAALGGATTSAAVEERVVRGALAVELLHVATLVHDDIIDGSAVRRGRPSVVAEAGTATAIVVGDLLLARGAAAAAQAGPAAAVWARALERMAMGQLLEAGLAADPSLAAHAEYAALKTAELFRSSAEIGALAVGADPDVVAAHGRFGLHFGVAFQHVDDLLDTVGDPRRLGKPVGTDAANGVPTAVALLADATTTTSTTSTTSTTVQDLVADELRAARSALPPGPGSADLGDWGAAALRRTLDSGLGTTLVGSR